MLLSMLLRASQLYPSCINMYWLFFPPSQSMSCFFEKTRAKFFCLLIISSTLWAPLPGFSFVLTEMKSLTLEQRRKKKSTNKAVGNYEIIPVFSSFFWLIFILQPFSYRAERWMHSYLQSRGESENNAVRRVAYVCVCLRWSTREREHVACLDIRDTETSQHNLVLKKSPSRSVGFFCFLVCSRKRIASQK